MCMCAPAEPGFLLGGGQPGRRHPALLQNFVHTFEAVVGRWGSVSAPAVTRVIGGAKERKNRIFVRGNFVNVVSLKYIGMI